MILTDWSNLKNIVDSKGLSIQWIDMSGNYICLAIDGGFSLQCNLDSTNPSDPDTADFIANYKEKGNQSVTTSMVQKLGADTVSICPFGTMFNAPANQTTTYDLRVASTVYLKGGVMYASPGNVGDYISVQVVDKDNVTGLGANTVLATYVNNWYVIPEDRNAIEDVSLSQPMMGGLYIRFIYVNTASNDSKVIVNLIAYQGTP